MMILFKLVVVAFALASMSPALAQKQEPALPTGNQIHTNKETANSRRIDFGLEDVGSTDMICSLGSRGPRMTPWFAKCERRIRAAGFDEKIFARKRISCLIHFDEAGVATASIFKSSGQVKVDQAAIDVIGNASPFPRGQVKADLIAKFDYPILEISLRSRQTNLRQPYVSYPNGPQYVPPDPALKQYYYWTPPKSSVRSSSMVWPQRNHF